MNTQNQLPDYTQAPWVGILALLEKYGLEIVLKEKRYEQTETN